jgi:hypothetical protein
MGWEIVPMPSCCSADVVTRLRGEYTTKTVADKQAAKLDMAAYYNEALPLPEFLRENLFAEGHAIPLDICFAAVVEDMSRHESGANLFIATDNVTKHREGDVEVGTFHTRGFMRWLARKGLAQVIRGVNGVGDDGRITTWSARLNIPKCKHYVNVQKTELSKLLKARFPVKTETPTFPKGPMTWQIHF